MFQPRYTITNKLLNNIGQIREQVGAMNSGRFPITVLRRFEFDARALSTFSSTSIEGNPLPLTEVKRILKSKPENIRDSVKEVMNYNDALIYLGKLIRSKKDLRLTNELICHVQKIVTEGLVPSYANGHYRQKPVFVNDHALRKTVYWAPDHQDVPKLMDDLIEYSNTNQNKIDPLIIAGIFHQQFVIIHPFEDGNGRTTRLMTKALLAKLGLNTFQLFSFENYYNANVTKYFKMVGIKGDYYEESKKWDFTLWLEYFTDGIIDELMRVQKSLPQATSLRDRLEDHDYLILDLIREKQVIKDSDYAKVTNRSRASRTLDFQKLIKLGMIERKGKARGTYYILSEND